MQSEAKWVISGIVGLFFVWMGTLSPESYQTTVVSAWIPVFAGVALVEMARKIFYSTKF